MSASGLGNVADELTETLDEMASEALDRAGSRADEADVPYERAIVEGFPHEAIQEYGADQDVDPVVMGASGRSGIKERLLGSTTDRVVQSVPTSVLVART